MIQLHVIRSLLFVVVSVALSLTATAQPMQWEALTDFQAGTCRNVIDIGEGALLLSLPVTKGLDFRGILRYETGTGDVAHVRPSNSPIRSFDTTGTGRIFCATESGMFFSDNGGQNWLADPQMGAAPTYHVRTLRGRTYAIADSGVVFLYNHALGQWERLGRVITGLVTDSQSMAFDGLTEDASGRLFLSEGTKNGWWTLRMSLDSGRTWEWVGWRFRDFVSSHASHGQDGLFIGDGFKLVRAFETGMTHDTVPGVNGTVTGIVEQNDGTLYLGIGEHVSHLVGPVGVMKSSDGGDSWTWLREGISVQHLAFMQDGSLLCSTSGHGLLLMDPTTGETSRLPLSYGNVTDLLVSPAGIVFAAVDSSVHLEVHRSADNGSTWVPCRSGVGTYELERPRMILDGQNRLTLGAGKWRRSTDGGDSFTDLTWTGGIASKGIVAAVTQAGEWMTIFDNSAPADSIWTFASSNDEGQNWMKSNIPFIAAHPSTDGPFDLKEVEPGYLLASGSIGLAFRQGSQASPWSRVGHWKPTDIIRTTDGTVYTGTRESTSSFITSIDHGVSWQAHDIRDSLVMRDAVHADGGVLAATARGFTRFGEMEPGTGGGLYFSTDLVNWTDVGAGLPTMDIACLARDSAGYLYAGTRGFGVYRSVLQYSAAGPAVLGVEAPLPVTAGIDIQISPQPAAGSTTVHCLLPSAASLTLGLYDMLGRQLVVLSDGRQFAAGLHHFSLDLAHVPAGTYILRASAAQGRVTTRLLVRTR